MSFILKLDPGVEEIDLEDMIDQLINSTMVRPLVASVLASLLERTVKADTLYDLASGRVVPDADRMESKVLALVEPAGAWIEYLEIAEDFQKVSDRSSN